MEVLLYFKVRDFEIVHTVILFFLTRPILYLIKCHASHRLIRDATCLSTSWSFSVKVTSREKQTEINLGW